MIKTNELEKTTKLPKTNKLEKNKKKVKQPKSPFEKGCVATLVIQIICVVFLISLLFIAPLVGLFGGIVFCFFIVSAIVWSIGTLGIGWYIPEVKEFFTNTWKFMEKVFNSAETVKAALQPHMLWLTLVLLGISLSGFICNIIYYLKKNKTNKGKFITSCVFAGVGIISTISILILYYAK